MPLQYVSGPMPRFSAQMERLKTQASEIHGATRQANQRPWQVPDENGWNGDVHNLSGAGSITDAYDRTEINNAYVLTLENANNPDETYGKIGESMNAKFQADYLACQERAFRTRVASSVRCAMHSAARRYGHGISTGIMDRMVKVAQDFAALAGIENIPAPNP